MPAGPAGLVPVVSPALNQIEVSGLGRYSLNMYMMDVGMDSLRPVRGEVVAQENASWAIPDRDIIDGYGIFLDAFRDQ
jgi:hypothetical protein